DVAREWRSLPVVSSLGKPTSRRVSWAPGGLNMLWQDLRAYLAQLDEMGELKHVSEADSEEEIGGITELVTERNGPSLLFDDVPGYPSGFRVASNLLTTVRRTTTALGIGSEPLEGASERWRAK